MAERRMFTKKVTDDDNFMGLSSSAQALYLHLSMAADDDGFCNQVSVSMFKAHASVQDLQALLEKRYIYQFENGVIVIKHWRMANALRKDRYTPTAFQEELSKLGLKDNGSYTWLPDGCQMVAERLPQVRLGKDSIGKNSLVEEATACPQPEMEFYSAVQETWNAQRCTKDILSIRPMTKREDMLRRCLLETDMEGFLNVVRSIDQQAWFRKRAEEHNPVTFDWFVDPNNFRKVLEGNYAEERKKPVPKQEPKPKNKFQNFDQRAYDDDYFDRIERKMMGEV